MRKHIVAGNWKMNKTFSEADDLVSGIMDKLEQEDHHLFLGVVDV